MPRGTEPVARITAFDASYSVSPTRTLPSPVRPPSPSITSILFFLNRPLTPPVSVLTTFARRSITAG